MEISELVRLELNLVILKSGEYILVSPSYLLETKDNLVSIMTQLHGYDIESANDWDILILINMARHLSITNTVFLKNWRVWQKTFNNFEIVQRASFSTL